MNTIFQFLKTIVPQPIKNLLNRGLYQLLDARGIEYTKRVPSASSNVAYNTFFWNRYAKYWQKDPDIVEDETVSPDQTDDYLEFIGDEWGRKEDVLEVLQEFIAPYVTPNSVVAEIGSGGGRIAAKVAPLVQRLHCFDISSEMLNCAQNALQSQTNVDFHLLTSARLPAEFDGAFDFIYSFDVFVHLDLHTIWKYFKSIHRALKTGGRTFLHTANLKTPGGWEKFSHQDTFSVEGHYFVSPEIIAILAKHAGFKLIKQSEWSMDNYYYNRDYLFVLEK